MNEQKCGTCRFFREQLKNKPRGYCHRHAPLRVELDDSEEGNWNSFKLYQRQVSVPPIVAYGDWCGEYEEKKA